MNITFNLPSNSTETRYALPSRDIKTFAGRKRYRCGSLSLVRSVGTMGHCLGSFGAMMPRDTLRTPSVRTHVCLYVDTQNNSISFQSKKCLPQTLSMQTTHGRCTMTSPSEEPSNSTPPMASTRPSQQASHVPGSSDSGPLHLHQMEEVSLF